MSEESELQILTLKEIKVRIEYDKVTINKVCESSDKNFGYVQSIMLIDDYIESLSSWHIDL